MKKTWSVSDRSTRRVFLRAALGAGALATPLATFAQRNRLPSMHGQVAFVEAGGLMSCGANSAERWRRAATYVDKILKGAKPADLPVEQPTTFEMVVKPKTAKALGVTMPQTVLVRAARVIE